MDPGTALAVVSIVLGAVKGLQSYYEAWKDCPEDVAALRQTLAWYTELFSSIDHILRASDQAHNVSIILRSIDECEDVCIELKAKLNKIKKEGSPSTVIESLKTRGREACYPFKKKSVLKLVALLQDCTEHLHLAINLLNLQSSLATLRAMNITSGQVISIESKVTDIDTRLAKQADESERLAILAWLGPIRMTNFHDALQASQTAGTCSWFINGLTFTKWKSEHGSKLWVNGSVGSGKSVLCSAAIEAARVLCGPLVYFYFSFKDGLTRSYTSLLKSILCQLCPPSHMLPHLKTLYDDCNNDFPTREATVPELELALFSTLREFANFRANNVFKRSVAEITLIVDALDEVPSGSQRDQVLELLEKLTSSTDFGLRIMATSRSEVDIWSTLDQQCQWDICTLEKEHIEKDINLYIKAAIKTNRRLERMCQRMPEMEVMITVALVVKGEGMFRWAALQMQALANMRVLNPEIVTKTVQTFPLDLYESYERLLTGLDPSEVPFARRALSWLVFARRPLLIEELVEATMIDTTKKPSFDPRSRLFENDLLELLSSLVQVDPPLKDVFDVPHGKHYVSLAHFSVKTYLTSERLVQSDARQFHMNETSSHLEIAQGCLAYLASFNTLHHRTEGFPLRPYSWTSWAGHALAGVVLSPGLMSFAAPGNNLRGLLLREHYALRSEADEDASHEYRENISELQSCFQTVTGPLAAYNLREIEHAISNPYFYEEWSAEQDLYQQLDNSIIISQDYSKSQIRLLELFTTDDELEEIRCQIKTYYFDHAPPYEAVSYTWGNPSRTEKIRLNGQSTRSPEKVHRILSRLRRTRTGIGIRRLWLDAICVNMKDIDERSYQVELMSSMYRRASAVAVCLDEERGMENAIRILNDVNHFLRASSSADEMIRDIVRKAYVEGTILAMWISFKTLLYAKWWSRVWTLQESAINPRVSLVYDDTVIDFDALEIVMEQDQTIREVVDPRTADAIEIAVFHTIPWQRAKGRVRIRRRYLNGHTLELPELLGVAKNMGATDPRDKIFALLGLCGPKQRIRPDYSLSSQTVFINTTFYILDYYRTLDILSFCSCFDTPSSSHHSSSGLPSWVPALSSPSDRHALFTGIFGNSSLDESACAGGDASQEFTVVKERSTLIIQGAVFGHVAEAELVEEFIPLLKPAYEVGRTDFRTNDGSTGLGPEDLDCGDIIIVIPGYPVPLLIREVVGEANQDSPAQRYRLVGECYIEDIMHGEFLRTPSFQIQEIVLV